MNQYYSVILESPFIYDDKKKIIVKSKKELDAYIKQRIYEYMRDWFNFKRRPIHQDNDNIFNDIKKIYKRTNKDYIYNSDTGTTKKSGYAYTINYLSKNKEIELLFCLWCSRVSKSELMQYAGFEEIE